MSKRISKLVLCGAAMSAASLAAAQGEAPAHAAAPADEVPRIDEVIVTAQKRSERIADVPMSITAMSGDQLARVGVTDTTSLTKIVPGFGYQQGAFGAPVFSIRGIGFYDNAIAVSPTVTIYQDQVALPYSIEARGATLDLERVEVLKGPQGTLFGMNSTGGAINYIAAGPTTQLEAGADLSFGRFNALDATAFVSGPLSDTVTARVAVQRQLADGWQRSATRPGDSLGERDFSNARMLLDWNPSDELSFKLALNGWLDRSDSQAAQFQGFYPAVPVTPLTQFVADGLESSPIATADARSADWDAGREYARDDKFYQGSLRADWQLTDELTLTSITAYSEFRGDDPGDVDGSAFTNFAMVAHRALLQTFSQELRFAGTAGPFSWMLGGNYQSDVANEFQESINQGTNNQIGPFLFTKLVQRADQDVSTKSVFGSLDYEVLDSVTLQASVRHTTQDRTFDGCIADDGPGPTGVPAATAFGFLSTILSGTPTVIPPGGCVTMNDTTFKPELAHSRLDEDNLSWRLGAKWRLSSDAMIYANATKGYKSGSYSLVPAILASQFTPVTQESVLAYEVGFKQSLLDRKADISGAAFYYDYADKQLLGNVLTPVFGTLPQLVNIPKSHVYGAELELVTHPFTGLRATVGATYVFSRVEQDPVDPAVPRDPFGGLTSYVGEAFPNTPRWQAVADVEYGFPIGSTSLNAFVGATGTYRSASDAAFGESPEFELPAYGLLDLRAGIESATGRWVGQIWARNVTDRYYWTNTTHLTDYLSRLSGMPATYGVTVSYRY